MSSPTIVAFLLGAALLGVSAVFDVLLHDVSFLVEDGSKLLGALVWATVPALIYGEWTAARERSPAPASSRAG